VLNDAPVPYSVRGPNLPRTAAPAMPTTGNFAVREEFDDATLGPQWLFVRTPHSQWWSIGAGELALTPRADRIGNTMQPSFVGRRFAHMHASATTRVSFAPQSSADEAGLMAVQNDANFIVFGLGRNGEGQTVLRLRRRGGDNDPAHGIVLAEQLVASHGPIELRMSIDAGTLAFAYSLDGASFVTLADNVDAAPLTTAGAGGFTGAIVGMYAEGGAD
jgi:alpha-N-arabinofuranosidase